MTAKSVMRNMNSKKAKTIIIVVGIVVCVLLGMLIYRKAEDFFNPQKEGPTITTTIVSRQLEKCRI